MLKIYYIDSLSWSNRKPLFPLIDSIEFAKQTFHSSIFFECEVPCTVGSLCICCGRGSGISLHLYEVITVSGSKLINISNETLRPALLLKHQWNGQSVMKSSYRIFDKPQTRFYDYVHNIQNYRSVSRDANLKPKP